MRRRTLALFTILLLLLPSGCGVESPVSPSEPPPTATATPAATPPSGDTSDNETPLPAGTTQDYTLERTLTVEEDRTLTLRLHGRATASGYDTWEYGIGSIDVLEGERLLQTLSVREAVDTAIQADSLSSDFWPSDYTSNFEADGFLATKDVNFDGFDDISVQWYLGNVNEVRLFWLWNAETERFAYAFSLTGYDFTVDEEAKQLVTEGRYGIGQYDTDFYSYDQGGALRRVKQVHQDLAQGLTTTYELVDGQWTQASQEAVVLPAE